MTYKEVLLKELNKRFPSNTFEFVDVGLDPIKRWRRWKLIMNGIEIEPKTFKGPWETSFPKEIDHAQVMGTQSWNLIMRQLVVI